MRNLGYRCADGKERVLFEFYPKRPAEDSDSDSWRVLCVNFSWSPCMLHTIAKRPCTRVALKVPDAVFWGLFQAEIFLSTICISLCRATQKGKWYPGQSNPDQAYYGARFGLRFSFAHVLENFWAPLSLCKNCQNSSLPWTGFCSFHISRVQGFFEFKMHLSREHFWSDSFYSFKSGLDPKEFLERLQRAFGEDALCCNPIFEWLVEFRKERASLKDEPMWPAKGAAERVFNSRKMPW